MVRRCGVNFQPKRVILIAVSREAGTVVPNRLVRLTGAQSRLKVYAASDLPGPAGTNSNPIHVLEALEARPVVT
jgi:hypothetical protein